MKPEEITVTILGRDYRVACAPDEKDQLVVCAQYLNQKMSAIRDSGKVLGTDNLAVMAALQITQEFFSARNADGIGTVELRRRLRELNTLADDVLTPQEKLF